jgi:hypothetical protein
MSTYFDPLRRVLRGGVSQFLAYSRYEEFGVS